MGSSKIVMFIGVPLGGNMSSRVRSSEKAKCKYEIFKEGCIIMILWSGDGVTGCYNPEGYSWIMRAPIDMYFSGCSLISYTSM